MTPHRSDLLERLRQEASASGGRRLRSIRALAAAWEVSAGSLQQAVAVAVAQGWLETRRGSGIWPSGHRPSPVKGPTRLDAIRVAETIARDIVDGRHSSGEVLPAPKDYAKRFEVHPSTVRKAMGILDSQGVVDRRGRAWATSRPVPGGSSRAPVVLCIGASDGRGQVRMDTDREWEFWREIQIEAGRCGLVPRLVAFDGSPLEIGEDVFGAVVSTWSMVDSSPLLDGLLRVRCPTAVWIVNQEQLPGERYRYARTMWFHDLSYGRGAGATMARFLAESGHRKIAWISPFHASSWARNRLAGMQAALPSGIEVFKAAGSWISEWDVQVEVLDNPEVVGRLDLEGLEAEDEKAALLRPLVELVTRDRALERFGPVLEAALESGSTLWVASSDLVASWCLRWLAARGLRVPRDLAMVGFDDAREASRAGLTSMRYDVQGMSRSMLRQILSSRQGNRLVTRYAGHVVERGSTAPVG